MSNSYFAFRRVDSFNRDKNRKDCFDILDMNGVSKNFKLVLASDCASNIDDCLDEDGTLRAWDSETGTGVQILDTFGSDDGLVSLLYSEGINCEETISIVDNSVSYNMGDGDLYVKAIFLVSYGNGSGYVMAYSINNVAVKIPTDELILNTTGLIWGLQHAGD